MCDSIRVDSIPRKMVSTRRQKDEVLRRMQTIDHGSSSAGACDFQWKVEGSCHCPSSAAGLDLSKRGWNAPTCFWMALLNPIAVRCQLSERGNARMAKWTGLTLVYNQAGDVAVRMRDSRE